MPIYRDTVIGQRFDVELAQGVRAKLAANERRSPAEVARGSNWKVL